MATNEEILAAFKNRTELEANRRELEGVIRRAQAKLQDMEGQLEAARSVSEVIDGLPIGSNTACDTVFNMRTIASGPGITERSVHAYQVAGGNHWYVRVYESYFDRDRPRFQGGHVVGLGNTWTRDEAREVAVRWLKGDESVLSL